MTVLVAVFSILMFLIAFHFLGIVPVATRAIATSRETSAVMRNPDLDDDAKEAAVQKASLALMKSFGSLVVRIVILLLAAFLPIFLASTAGLVPAETVLDFLLRWDVILITTVVILLAVFMGPRIWRR